jgi:hypothetical protein
MRPNSAPLSAWRAIAVDRFLLGAANIPNTWTRVGARRRSHGAMRCARRPGLFNRFGGHQVAKTISKRKEYTKDDLKLLKAHSKARTPVAKVSKLMKRSEGSLRQKARAMGIGLGHQR